MYVHARHLHTCCLLLFFCWFWHRNDPRIVSAAADRPDGVLGKRKLIWEQHRCGTGRIRRRHRCRPQVGLLAVHSLVHQVCHRLIYDIGYYLSLWVLWRTTAGESEALETVRLTVCLAVWRNNNRHTTRPVVCTDVSGRVWLLTWWSRLRMVLGRWLHLLSLVYSYWYMPLCLLNRNCTSVH